MLTSYEKMKAINNVRYWVKQKTFVPKTFGQTNYKMTERTKQNNRTEAHTGKTLAKSQNLQIALQ